MSKTLEKPVTYKSPLYEMTQTTPTCLWNDSAALSELSYSIEHGAVGLLEPRHRAGRLKKEAHLWNDRIRWQSNCRQRPKKRSGGNWWRRSLPNGRNAAACLRSPPGPDGRLDSNRSTLLSRRCRPAAAGPTLRCPGAKHDREDSRHGRWHSCDGGGDVSRHQHQCDRLLRLTAMHCGGRSYRAWPETAGEGRVSISPAWARFARSWWGDSMTG